MSTHDNEPDQTEETTAAGWPSADDAPTAETSPTEPVASEGPAVEATAADEPAPPAPPAPPSHEPAAEPPSAADAAPGPESAARGLPARPSWALAGGLIGVALVAGGGIGYAINDSDGPSFGARAGLAARADLSRRADGFGHGGSSRQDGFGGDGRTFGGERVQGTVSATTDSSITVESSDGTATYAVDSSTRVIVNGQSGAFSDVPVGETVLLLVGQGSSGDDVVRLLLVGSMPSMQRGGLGGPGGQAPPDGGRFPSLNGPTTSGALG